MIASFTCAHTLTTAKGWYKDMLQWTHQHNVPTMRHKVVMSSLFMLCEGSIPNPGDLVLCEGSKSNHGDLLVCEGIKSNPETFYYVRAANLILETFYYVRAANLILRPFTM